MISLTGHSLLGFFYFKHQCSFLASESALNTSLRGRWR
nr:MAG TPA: hypothetical protein [Caudoviricetes sp.]